jgi:Zn-dependent peptidase ImmA (M78 family)
MRITLSPDVLRWARERAELDETSLAKKVLGAKGTAKAVKEWETTGELALRLVEIIAKKTHTAFGYLFLSQRPKENLPIRDFRTVDNSSVLKPSADLLDVLHRAQLRQNWYREYLIRNGDQPLPFVGDASVQDSPVQTAFNIRRTLGIGPKLTVNADKWETAFRETIEAIESSGILFLRAGYAGGYTGRKLSVDEFRGFAISDEYAPLIFINGADAPNAQMFTLAHELAHIWLGVSGISNLNQTYPSGGNTERYCNVVAAEVLLPLEEIKVSWRKDYHDYEEVFRLSKKYKVSNVVVARRAHDAGFLSKERYESIFRREIRLKKKKSGGDYYTNEQYQNSRRFSVAVLRDTKEGKTLFHDAMKLLGIKKRETFKKYMESLQMEAG